MKTVADLIAPQTEEKQKEVPKAQALKIRRAQIELAILHECPLEAPAPTISNEDDCAFFGQEGAWVSFNKRFEDDWKASWLLELLESNGWTPLPATSVVWDNYASQVEPGALEDIPKIKYPGSNQHKFTSGTPVAPLWVKLSRFGGPKVLAYYRTPQGRTVKVHIESGIPAAVYANRHDVLRGDWYYDHGTAGVNYPEAWNEIIVDGKLEAQIGCANAHCYTQQSLDGYIRWVQDYPQSTVLLPSVIAKYLEK